MVHLSEIASTIDEELFDWATAHGWSCKELWFMLLLNVQRNSTGRRAHSCPFFCSTDQGVQHVCTSFFHERARICARRTTHHDLASVILDK